MRATPIVALDVPDAERARVLVRLLGATCRFYKVGSELFTAEGPAMVRWLVDDGCDVFLDLKFHDIPSTVEKAARSAAALGATLVTVHASGGRAMIEAGVAGAGTECRILAVSVLTSHTATSLGEAWGRRAGGGSGALDVSAEVLRLAELARAAGAYGLVCAGDEAATVRARHGDALRLLVPGVRLAGDESHDHARVVTPMTAAAAGATYVVLGRSVTAAASPRDAMLRVRDSLA
ncbi:MAG: orotidine-5'-phosphate decarboxylase [Gemmatimonadaceae bacterium]